MKKITITKNIQDEIFSEYLLGSTISELNRKFKYGRKKIRNLLKENNIYVQTKKTSKLIVFSDSDILNIIYLYSEENLSLKKIGLKYNCSETKINSIMKNNNINTERKRDFHNFKKYEVQSNYFDVIDNEGKSYWFGFILADGHVTKAADKIIITLHNKDIDILEKFKLSIKSSHPIRFIDNNKYCNITIGCSHLAKSLREKGINNRKSWGFDVNKVVNSVPENLLNHMIRGYFDGDGCIGIYKQTYYKNNFIYHFSILGIEDFMLFIANKLNISSLRISKDKRTESTYQLIVRKKQDIINIREYLYNDSSLYMDRKRNKIFSII